MDFRYCNAKVLIISWSLFEAGPRSLHSTSVPVQPHCGRLWASQFCLQKSPGQIGLLKPRSEFERHLLPALYAQAVNCET